MKLLGKYKNGNYNVIIFDDGTKVRKNDLDFFDPEYPESMDIKITDMCDRGCPFCHENSTPSGKHGDIMNLKFIDTLMPYTELAIGGGNPLEHPQLVEFLEKCKKLKLIPSMTVNQVHFIKDFDKIKYLVDNKLIYGLGISLVSVNDSFIEKVKQFDNAVIHVINGVQPLSDLQKLYDNNLKILILGYKEFRRGKDFYSEKVEEGKTDLYNELAKFVKHFKVVSFDNLALKQLNPRRLVSQEEWDNWFMGDDGQFTMYVDCVNELFAQSSTAPFEKRYTIKDNIKDMFDVIRNNKKMSDLNNITFEENGIPQ